MKKIISLLLASVLILPGCWDIREINELALVMEVGVDKAEEPDGFEVTIQVANAAPQASSELVAAGSESFKVFTAKGSTIFEAIRELVHVSSKRIMWGHNYIIVIGETLARSDIRPVINFFTHNPELRMKTAVVVSKGSAKEYIGSKAGLEPTPGQALAEIMNYAKLSPEYLESDMLLLSKDYYDVYKQPILSTIQFKEEKLKPAEGPAAEALRIIEFSGAAIFNKSKMAGFLTKAETRGYSWVRGRTKNAQISVTEGQDKFAVETNSVKAKIWTFVIDGQPKVWIDIYGSGHIVEEDGTTDLSIEDFKKRCGELVNKKITDDVRACLDAVQKKYKVDTINFGDYFHLTHKGEWHERLDRDWERLYPDIPVTVTVDIKITGSTLNQIPEKELPKAGERG